MEPRDALVAGATGLVGREIVRHFAAEAAAAAPGATAATLHLLLRRPPPADGPLSPQARVHVVDFAALPRLPKARVAFCALGTTIKTAGSEAAFRAVDLDAVVAFATAARAAGVTRFGLVSALGADARSRSFYSRTKGEAEAALQALGFERLVLARPSLLAGDRDALGQPSRVGERLALAATRPLAALIPVAWRPIEAATVARALLRETLRDAAPRGVRVLASAEMQGLGAAGP